MTDRPIIFLEFNELCPSLMTQFIEEGHLPNFKRLRDSSAIFVTEAMERAPYLEPWIQWINVHTGVPFSEHGVERLGESAKVKQPAIWDMLCEAGRKVWICGSMNVHCTTEVKGDLLPDPWTAESMTRPPELLTYNRFVRKQVQEHSNASARFERMDYVRFLKFMLTHGLSLYTIRAAMKQLSGERKKGKRWRRAFILDLLQYDVFRSLFQKHKPDFSTFFLNSTAHMQHCYWRNMQPEVFKIQPTEQEQREYSSAILEGYVHMDKLIERILALGGEKASIYFATAISQQPYLKYDDLGGKHIYRPTNIAAFAKWAGIQNLKQCNPVMAEQFWLEFSTGEEAEAAAAVLNGITVDGEKAFSVHIEDAALITGFSIRKKIAKDAVMTSAANGALNPFFDQLYAIEGMKSGMHHPDGLLWIRDERISKSSNPRVAIESITPTILDMLGLAIPFHLKAPSLLRQATAAKALEAVEVPVA
ncbi:MAG TPA: hypothetical protein VFU55_11395 [Terracidiphilus sp.]|nr:hypothetical protein [Terracidiphilus sp.]